MHSVEKVYHLADGVTVWRRHLHPNPELEFAVHETARFVADKASVLWNQPHRNGKAGTVIVAFIQGEVGGESTIGLRADMDALPTMLLVPFHSDCDSLPVSG